MLAYARRASGASAAMSGRRKRSTSAGRSGGGAAGRGAPGADSDADAAEPGDGSVPPPAKSRTRRRSDPGDGAALSASRAVAGGSSSGSGARGRAPTSMPAAGDAPGPSLAVPSPLTPTRGHSDGSIAGAPSFTGTSTPPAPSRSKETYDRAVAATDNFRLVDRNPIEVLVHNVSHKDFFISIEHGFEDAVVARPFLTNGGASASADATSAAEMAKPTLPFGRPKFSHFQPLAERLLKHLEHAMSRGDHLHIMMHEMDGGQQAIGISLSESRRMRAWACVLCVGA